MKLFWPIYLASLVAGTVAVYATAPLARPYLARWRGAEEAAQATAEEAAPQRSAPRPTPPAVRAPVPQTAAAPAKPAAARPAAGAEEDDDTPPAMRGVYLASYGDRPGWGITVQRATYYKLDGTRQGSAPGGILFNVTKAHQSSKGAMLECAFVHNNATNGPYLVSRSDVSLFTASYDKLSPRQLQALKDYYALKAKVGTRRSELLAASAEKNPHFAAATSAYKAFAAHAEQAKALAAKRESATELDKANLEERLREMKVAEVKLRADLEAANLKFKEWKQQHASEIAKPDNDPDIKKWSAEMANLRSVVPGLAM